MSADILRRAAKTLREHADKATPGPWEVVPPAEDVLFSRVQSTSLTGWQGEVAEVHTPDERWPDHEYIALMHPPVALALAVVLDGWADQLDRRLAFNTPATDVSERIIVRLIDLACKILHEEAPDVG